MKATCSPVGTLQIVIGEEGVPQGYRGREKIRQELSSSFDILTDRSWIDLLSVKNMSEPAVDQVSIYVLLTQMSIHQYGKARCHQ